MKMSNLAWDTLLQIAICPRHDEELISKTGRTELMKLGLAKRERRCPECRLSLNELTSSGLMLAVHLIPMPERSKEWPQ